MEPCTLQRVQGYSCTLERICHNSHWNCVHCKEYKDTVELWTGYVTLEHMYTAKSTRVQLHFGKDMSHWNCVQCTLQRVQGHSCTLERICYNGTMYTAKSTRAQLHFGKDMSQLNGMMNTITNDHDQSQTGIEAQNKR